jgi:N-acetylglucosaminyl-diphospho-decaprenol L-rhamnosyltransferase
VTTGVSQHGGAASSEPDVRDLDLVVLIVTYNNAADLPALLDSLPSAAPGLTPRILVVDNGSSDDTVAVARSRPGITVVESGGNIGFAGGINVGRRQAGTFDALAIVNPDSTLGPGCLRILVDALADPTVGIVAPTIREVDGERFHSLRRAPSLLGALGESLLGARLPNRPVALTDTCRRAADYDREHDVDWVSGAMVVVAAACDAAVGDWDERYFLYSEETDYARRARARGFRIRFVPDAEVVHVGGGSGRSSALMALMAVNRVREFEVEHGRLETLAFRAAVALGHLLRSGDEAHRQAFRYLVARRRWKDLPAGEPGSRATA